jgi:RNA polymerase sigma-70 factor, ECF subfamily
MGLLSRKYYGLSDEELMQLVIKGEVKAFEEIYDRYCGKLLNYFHRMLWKDNEKSQDFMQELFTKIIERPQMFNPERLFKTWIYSVANNMCKNEYKKQEVRQEYHTAPLESLVNHTMEYDVTHLDHKAFHIRLYDELDKLDEAHKTTFILRYKEELSLNEISQVMECSEGTVKSRIFYTLKKISGKLHVYNPNKLR